RPRAPQQARAQDLREASGGLSKTARGAGCVGAWSRAFMCLGGRGCWRGGRGGRRRGRGGGRRGWRGGWWGRGGRGRGWRWGRGGVAGGGGGGGGGRWGGGRGGREGEASMAARCWEMVAASPRRAGPVRASAGSARLRLLRVLWARALSMARAMGRRTPEASR